MMYWKFNPFTHPYFTFKYTSDPYNGLLLNVVVRSHSLGICRSGPPFAGASLNMFQILDINKAAELSTVVFK